MIQLLQTTGPIRRPLPAEAKSKWRQRCSNAGISIAEIGVGGFQAGGEL
jgi:hypothetical protein